VKTCKACGSPVESLKSLRHRIDAYRRVSDNDARTEAFESVIAMIDRALELEPGFSEPRA
jgi:hypothetical protein